MEERKLPQVAIGTWSWGVGEAGGDQVFGHHLGTEQLQPVFECAMDNGLSLFDTAVVYGMGDSERILGMLTQKYHRHDVLVSTKFTPQIASDSDDSVEEMCKESLTHFQTDYIDIYWIHNPADIERWTPQLIPLVKSGKIKHVGVSNHNLQQIKRVEEILGKEGIPLYAVQNHYSLLYRSSQEAGILDYCQEKNIHFFAYMVLEQGALTGQYDQQHLLPEGSQRGNTYNPMMKDIEKLIKVMRDLAIKYDATVAQIAIAHAIAQRTIPIIGVTKVNQVLDLKKAIDMKLSLQDIELLEQTASCVEVNTKGSWENPMH